MKKNKLQDIFLIKEDTLGGIDELVYNPVTKKPANEFDKGADGGVVKDSISWDGHEDHLHIGATNRDVMIKLIDKAYDMGLNTTENPYAKNDPNKTVDAVHSTNSFHYKTFPGTPLVGAGVDISGDKGKIREFIRWINANYKNKSVQKQSTNSLPKPSTVQTDSTDKTSTSSFDELSFLNPVLNQLSGVGQHLSKQYDKSINTFFKEEILNQNKKVISEIKRINKLMKD